jgi:hypothetical protein
MRSRLMLLAISIVVMVSVMTAWILNASTVSSWLAVHTGTVNESGPYYGFWSGFGSDLAEFGIIGAIGTGVYQIVRKYNCHEPRCWRVGNHPAAGGQFLLCYRHHPDYHGTQPSSEMIRRLHRAHQERQAILDGKLRRHGAPARPTAANDIVPNEARRAPIVESNAAESLDRHHQTDRAYPKNRGRS